MSKAIKTLLVVFLFCSLCFSQRELNPDGYRGIAWGSSVAEAQAILQEVPLTQLTARPRTASFPAELNIARYQILRDTVAGYPARTTLYFFDDQFFQAVVDFDFSRFTRFDFNFNVFISVERYFNYIRTNTLNFVADIYTLLTERYGRRQPVFRTLDPRYTFVALDNYLAQERWNLRYNPSEFYRAIQTQSFAQWRFPRTEVRFSIAINAADKRFEYVLSLASTDLMGQIERDITNVRTRGL
ncbi:MAG: hypothetical protein FWE23_06950 [Chitinivibrionia bacterium]|nr:hypothetical protein [Chitinivibrionia bacterium]